MTLPRALVAFFSLSVILCGSGRGEGPPPVDRHYLSDDSQCLYRRSAFAHGYMHGYEEGFHKANLDWHMGRIARGMVRPFHMDKAMKKSIAYRNEYGDKNTFLKGFEQGYRAAYNDVADGRSFRALSEVRAAAEGMQGVPLSPSRTFDDGFQAGVTAGQLSSAPVSTDIPSATRWCIEQMRNGSAEFCEAYARGLRFTVGQRTNQETARAQRPQR